MEIKCGKKMVLFITFYVIILAVTPFECWKSLLGFLMVARKKLNIFELFESSTIYHLVFRFDDVKKAGKNFFLSSDPKYQDSDGEFMYRRLVRDIIYTHKKAKSEFNLPPLMRSRIVPSESEKAEALQSLHAASLQQATGHFVKARKLLEHAFILDPDNIDVLIALGEVIERSYYRRSVQQVALPSTKSLIPIYGQVATDDADGLILTAEHLYTKALIVDPSVSKACLHRERLMPIVEEIDQRILNAIDFKVRQFYHIPESDPGLRRAKVEDYFKHVYHSNAIEGNTLTLAQTRSILETRLAVGGKSLLEQNEVFIADHQPPPPSSVPDLMSELIDWLGSDEITHMHPIELAALTHWKLVFIHPFYDGNGRTARLLMNLILMRSGFPPAIIKIEDRVTYYELLKTANDGDVRPFIRFIAKCAERTLDGYLEAALNPQKKSDHVTRIPIESVFNDEESSSIPPIFQESQSISSSSSPDYNVQYPPPSQQHAVHPFPSRINYFADPEDLTMPLAIPPDIIYAGG
ncbi:Protein adenylyltransferase FICD [Schistosoma japonicum]|nr:Protein adenylyltransferase FICD [Schistosoma japonicum]